MNLFSFPFVLKLSSQHSNVPRSIFFFFLYCSSSSSPPAAAHRSAVAALGSTIRGTREKRKPIGGHANVSTSCKPSRTVRPTNPIRTRIYSTRSAPGRRGRSEYYTHDTGASCGRRARAFCSRSVLPGRRAAAARAGSTTTTSRAHE